MVPATPAAAAAAAPAESIDEKASVTANLWIIVIAAAILLFWLRGRILSRGIPQYGAAAVAQKLKTPRGVILVDVRSTAERAARSIGGSIHIPLAELRERHTELDRYRDREIVCYCATGARSASAAHLLKGKGYRAANLTGGISAWSGS